MPLEYSRPPSALALELEDVAKRSRELTEADLPLSFSSTRS
jgi:hypothetical protein